MGRNESPGGAERSGLTLRQWVDRAAEELARAGVESPRVDAALILCHALRCDRTHLLAHPTNLIDPADLDCADGLLVRRLKREPLPHLLGEWEFMGRRYEVGPQALIPRPETESLVQAVVERLRRQVPFTGLTPQPPSLPGKGEPDNLAGCELSHPSPRGRRVGGEARVPHQPLVFPVPNADRSPLRLLDVGTGTGCIAIELALRLPKTTVTSIDLSAGALELASRTVARFGLQDRVTLLQARFPEETHDLGLFDAIVSNPPYIPSEEVDRLAPELTLFEPRAALDGGPDGLHVIRALVSDAPRHLKPGGMLAMEIGCGQAERVTGLLDERGWVGVKTVPDLAGIDRVVLARLSS